MQQPHFSLVEVAPPALEPVSLADVKPVLRIDAGDNSLDPHLARLITMARQIVERYTGKALVQRQFLEELDRFPLIPNSQYAPGNPNAVTPVMNNLWPLDPSAWAIVLPRSPVVSVDLVQFVDDNGNEETLDPSQYQLDDNSEPARIAPTSGAFWPSPRFQPNAIQITFTAGYGPEGGTAQASAAAVPASLQEAIIATVGWWFDNPNGPAGELPESVKQMLHGEQVAECW